MAVDETKYDASDLQDLVLEDLDTSSSCHGTTSYQQGYFDDLYESPLCVPQDPLDELDWYPNFPDDFISLAETENLVFQDYSGDNSLKNYDPKDDDYKRVSLKERYSDYISSPSNEGLEKEDFFSEKDDGTLIDPPVTPVQIGEGNQRAGWKEYYGNSTNGVFGAVFPKKPRTSSSKKGPGGRQRKCYSRELMFKYQVPGRFSNVDDTKRECSHCQTETTPQWRMGPLGPKTLCNACGVRYKSGRLLPEYRPVASPTFDVGKHSNFHRKILKRKGINAYY